MEDKITVQKEDILKAYNQASEEQKTLLENMFGKDIFKPNDIKERVKSFEDACNELGENNSLVQAYRTAEFNISGNLEDILDVIAYLKLRIICAALNEGWKPQFTEDERRWYPWFILWTEEELKADKKLRIFCGRSDNAGAVSYSFYSACLAVKSEELAEYCGKQFIDIWADFISA